MTNPNPNPTPPPPPPTSSPLPSKEQVGTENGTTPAQVAGDAENREEVPGEAENGGMIGEEGDQQMEDAGAADCAGPRASPATVFRIRLKQPPSGLQHKMRVPELCRNFRYTLELFAHDKGGNLMLLN